MNYINQSAAENLAKTSFACVGAGPIRDQIRVRLEIAGAQALLCDPRNARRIRPRDLVGKDEWVLAKIAYDPSLRMFSPHRDWPARLEAAAQRAARLCDAREARAAPMDSEEFDVRIAARQIAAKIEKSSFADIELHLGEFARVEASARELRARKARISKAYWDPERVLVGDEAHWRLVTTAREFYGAGLALENCWREDSVSAHAFLEVLTSKTMQFWTYHDALKAPATVGLILNVKDDTIEEVRGVRNRTISPASGAVRGFMRAKNCTTRLLSYDLSQALDADRLRRIADILREASLDRKPTRPQEIPKGT